MGRKRGRVGSGRRGRKRERGRNLYKFNKFKTSD